VAHILGVGTHTVDSTTRKFLATVLAVAGVSLGGLFFLVGALSWWPLRSCGCSLLAVSLPLGDLEAQRVFRKSKRILPPRKLRKSFISDRTSLLGGLLPGRVTNKCLVLVDTVCVCVWVWVCGCV
jgi:hypothetical protein